MVLSSPREDLICSWQTEWADESRPGCGLCEVWSISGLPHSRDNEPFGLATGNVACLTGLSSWAGHELRFCLLTPRACHRLCLLPLICNYRSLLVSWSLSRQESADNQEGTTVRMEAGFRAFPFFLGYTACNSWLF